jgi:cysteine synthase A
MIHRECDIGYTPCIQVNNSVYAKLEHFNRSGSIKDRPVYHILKEAEKEKLIFPGQTVLVEATSGNTGIALAYLGRQLGYKVKIVMPSNMSAERKTILRSLGAELILCSEGNFLEAIDIRNNICNESKNHFNVNQFHNLKNIEAHYYGTGDELLEFITRNKIELNGFICGTGTGGTFMGVYKRLKPIFPDAKFCLVEPAESPVMSGGAPGIHGIQGIGDGSKFLVDLECADQIITVKTEDAIDAAKNLNLHHEHSLAVGVSSGANYIGASILACSLGGIVFTIFPDHCNRYNSVFNFKQHI